MNRYMLKNVMCDHECHILFIYLLFETKEHALSPGGRAGRGPASASREKEKPTQELKVG
jgi:hypothetical protein